MIVRAAMLAILLAGCSDAQGGPQELAQNAAPVTSPVDTRSEAISAFAKTCEPWDDWDKPAPPFQIFGSTYYVGTCGISAILLADPEGHILIDSGTEAGAKVVLANIQTLGFAPEDIALIAHSHEHFDHVGGHALIQRASGARVIASETSAPVLISGVIDSRDPQFGTHKPMQPVAADVIDNTLAKSGDVFRSGAAAITALETPGHSPGALSWHWRECNQAGECRNMVYADSLSPFSRDGYKFSDHPEYLALYRNALSAVATLDCDILLTPHPSFSKMIEQAAKGTLEGGMTCEEYTGAITARLDKRLTTETGR